MLNVGAHIGAGIFLVQGIILNEVGSVGMVIVLFAVGAVVSMFGACAYVELGCMLPISGKKLKLISI
jgi:amino acid permease